MTEELARSVVLTHKKIIQVSERVGAGTGEAIGGFEGEHFFTHDGRGGHELLVPKRNIFHHPLSGLEGRGDVVKLKIFGNCHKNELVERF